MSEDSVSDVYTSSLRRSDHGPGPKAMLGGLAWSDAMPGGGFSQQFLPIPWLQRPRTRSQSGNEATYTALAHRPERIICHRREFFGPPLAAAPSAQWWTWDGSAWTSSPWALSLLPRGSAEDELSAPGWPTPPPGGWPVFDFFPYLPASLTGTDTSILNPWRRMVVADEPGAPQLVAIVLYPGAASIFDGSATTCYWLWWDRPIRLGPAGLDADAIKVGPTSLVRTAEIPELRPATNAALPNLVRAPYDSAIVGPLTIKAGYVQASDGTPSGVATMTPTVEQEGIRVWRPRIPSRGPIGILPGRDWLDGNLAPKGNNSSRTVLIGSNLVTVAQGQGRPGDALPNSGVQPQARVASTIPSAHAKTPSRRRRPGRANTLTYDHGQNVFGVAGIGYRQAFDGTLRSPYRVIQAKIEDISNAWAPAGQEVAVLTLPSVPSDRVISAGLAVSTAQGFYNLFCRRLNRSFYVDEFVTEAPVQFQRSGAVPIKTYAEVTAGTTTDGHFRIIPIGTSASLIAAGLQVGDIVSVLVRMQAAIPRDRTGIWPVPHLSEIDQIFTGEITGARTGGDFELPLTVTLSGSPPVDGGGALIAPSALLTSADLLLWSHVGHSFDAVPTGWTAEGTADYLALSPTIVCGGLEPMWDPMATYNSGDYVSREIVDGSGYFVNFICATSGVTSDPRTNYIGFSADWAIESTFGSWFCNLTFPAITLTKRYPDQPRHWALTSDIISADAGGLTVVGGGTVAGTVRSVGPLVYDATGPTDEHWPGCVPDAWLPPGGWAE